MRMDPFNELLENHKRLKISDFLNFDWHDIKESDLTVETNILCAIEYFCVKDKIHFYNFIKVSDDDYIKEAT